MHLIGKSHAPPLYLRRWRLLPIQQKAERASEVLKALYRRGKLLFMPRVEFKIVQPIALLL